MFFSDIHHLLVDNGVSEVEFLRDVIIAAQAIDGKYIKFHVTNDSDGSGYRVIREAV